MLSAPATGPRRIIYYCLSVLRRGGQSAWQGFSLASLIAGVTLVGAVSGWLASDPLLGLGVGSVLVVGIATVGSYRLWSAEERRAFKLTDELRQKHGGSPRLRLGDPIQKDQVGITASDGQWHGFATFIVVPVINERGGGDARDVHARLSVESLAGEVLIAEVPARWAHSPQAAQLDPLQPTSGADMNEVTLKANGRPHDIDTVMTFNGASLSFIWNNDSMKTLNPFIQGQLDERYRIEQRAFAVRLTVEGSNVEPLETVVRVENFFPGYRILDEGDEPLPGSA